ncbi:hypothetical protein JTB14_032749 [Gonioctena quinquepunctata]|nr:hypothetical protein JTB14_032749 [Gonioctena quinquepunctata]
MLLISTYLLFINCVFHIETGILLVGGNMERAHEVELYLGIATFLGICPWQRSVSTFFYLSKLYIILCVLFTACAISFKVSITYVGAADRGTFYFLVDWLETGSELAFSCCLCLKSFLNSVEWYSLLSTTLGVVEEKPRHKGGVFIKILFLHLILLSSMYVISFSWFGTAGREQEIGIFLWVTFLTCMLMFYYQFVLVGLIWRITSILSKRYVDVKINIEKAFSVYSWRKPNKALKLAIRKIKHEYTYLFRRIQDFNRIFGISIFFFMASTVTTLLNCCNWGLHFVPIDQSMGLFIISLCVNALSALVSMFIYYYIPIFLS